MTLQTSRCNCVSLEDIQAYKLHFVDKSVENQTSPSFGLQTDNKFHPFLSGLIVNPCLMVFLTTWQED